MWTALLVIVGLAFLISSVAAAAVTYLYFKFKKSGDTPSIAPD